MTTLTPQQAITAIYNSAASPAEAAAIIAGMQANVAGAATYSIEANGNTVIANPSGIVLASASTTILISQAPQNLIATAGQALAVLNWLPPAVGQPTSYQITTTPATTTTTVTPSSNYAPLAQAISGLTNGTAYTFTVTPINAAGNGTAATSNSVTPSTAPGGLSAITGLALWYDAQQEAWTTGSNNVATLTDRSGNGATATGSGTNPNFSTTGFGTNNLKSIIFKSTAHSSENDRMVCNLKQSQIGGRMTVFTVMQFDDVTNNQRIWSFADVSSNSNGQAAVLDHNVAQLRGFSDNNTNGATSNIVITTPYIISFESPNVYLNGAVGGGSMGMSPSKGGIQQLWLNCDIGSWGYGDMHFAEMLVFNRALTQAERWSVEAYLSAKYAITVSQS